MAFLTTSYIQAMLGGAVTGAAKLAAFGDASAVAGWIARADAEVASAANRGGYPGVAAAAPTPSTGPAFEMLQSISFDEWWVLANNLGREIDVGRTVGEASAKLYRDSPEEPRINLPGLERDALGGSSGGDINNGSDSTITSAAPVFTIANLSDGGYG